MTREQDSQIITEMLDFDGGREVTVFVPDSPPEFIVYAGDGALIAPWGASIVKPSTMVVGVHSITSDDEMVRIREYSPDFEPAVFAAHEKFFVEDVRQWLQSRFKVALPPERTAVCGVSAGGELSLALGIRHPDVYGHVFSMSPGGGFRPGDLPDVLPRCYLTGGTLEPWFLENATRWADALSAAGADVVMTERHGDHGDPFWAEEFPRMVEWMAAGVL